MIYNLLKVNTACHLKGLWFTSATIQFKQQSNDQLGSIIENTWINNQQSHTPVAYH